MDPDGQPLTPGTSYGPPPFSSAQNPNPAAVLRSTLESPCPPRHDDLMSAKCTWDQSGEEGSRQSEGPQTEAEPGRSAQRRFKSSAFPSSLTWDSDSEKETLDEEELLNFSNPHGLAAHSPGSPSSGYRLDSEDDQEPGKLHFHTETGTSSPVEGHSDNSESTKTEEPNICRLGQIELADGEVWNVSDGAKPSLSKVKPKAACQVEEEEANTEGGIRSKGKETKQPERDVYTFPGDSDPESPPPAPWAHCTFIQRCRKKRVLLRPFSGLGSSKRTSPEAGKLVKLHPPRSKCTEDVKMNPGMGVYDYDESGFGEGAVETLRVGSKAGEGDQKDEASGVGPGNDIFTCVECSIYFKKQLHLQEHMAEHCQSGRRSGKSGRFRCEECGWNLPTRPALADHRQRHQESRLKILEEIGKLDESEKAQEVACAEPDVTQRPVAVANPGKTSDSEKAKTPPPSPPSVSTPDTGVLGLDAALAKSVRASGPARSAPACRRRFVCAKCNFSTRTSQALANHSKTHNRKKPVFQAAASPTSSASTSLACGHCAFLTSSQAVLREHQGLVHPGQVSFSETNPSSKSNADAHVSRIPSRSEQPSEAQSDATRGKSLKGTAASEDTAAPEGTPALPTARDGFKCPGNKRLSARGKAWMDLTKYEEDGVPRSPGEEQDCDQSGELNFELPPQPENSSVRGTTQAGAQHTTDASSGEQSAIFSPPTKKGVKDKEKQGEQQERKVFFLRRSSRVSAAPAQSDSDDDDDDGDDEDIDEERVRCFLSEGLLDEDKDEIDEDSEALRSVERKCPYCPDRFHNGIGLANHVRGHLNRVGVSYNVRHFISPEEVNAIEKKFSYQKKKKKVANFDPDTFSVMHCEFCSAGFDTRAGLSSHARAHLRDFGITNWDVTISPIHILRELFSSRPDLVIPTAPPRSPSCSPGEDEDDEEDEEEEEEEEEKYSQEEGIIEVKLEEETSERDLCASDEGASGSNQSWMKTKGVKNHGGDGKEAAEEEDEDDLSAPDALNSSGNADGSSPEEDADAKEHDLKCEVCDSRFGSRRGLSSHARSHLRQLGVSVSESSGAPIDLLRQIAKERKASPSLSEPPPAAAAAPKDEELEDMDVDVKPIPLPVLAKARSSPAPTPSPGASPAPSLPGSPSPVVKKAPISSLLPVSSPLRSPEHKAGGMKSLTSGLSATSTIAAAKPLWAPQENDAPLNLTLEVDPNKDIVCQLCGAWFETRKGLSSHARAHLRHFGVEYSESKGSPIDLLNQLIHTDDFKHKAGALQLDGLPPPVPSPKLPLLTHSSSSPSSSSSSSLIYKVTAAAGGGSASKATSSSSLPGPPAKRLKASSMQVFRLSSGELMALSHSEPPKEIGCEYCGEYFENRKGLSSHARSHLRQMGITEWSVNGSPIDTLREIIARRGLPCALPLKALKTPPPSSPGPPCSPLSASSSPSATLLGRLPFAFARPSSPPSKSAAAPPPSPSGLSFKPKPEPVQLEVTAPGAVGPPGGFSAEPLNSGWGSSDSVFPLNLAMAHEVEPTRDIRCEFCGEYFENRKGLSSHARSHLRQMGITEWSVNGSPIDTLREVMHKRGAGASFHSDHGVKKESSRGASSPPWENAGGASSSEGFAVSSFQPSKFRKSPLSLLQSGSKYHKQSLGSLASSAATPAGRFFRMSPLGKRPLSEEPPSVETAHTSPHRLKTFSPLPQDFSFKRKPSPDKHGHQDPSCELCGFYFENRKALASHARAHLRQFGVTEWCVNGSPIETLSAWMRSRPQKVLEMHRSYMQGNRSAFKKKAPSSSSSSSQWSSSLAVSFVRPLSHEIPKIPKTSSKAAEHEAGPSLQAAPGGPGPRSPGLSRLGGGGGLPLQAQVARSELNVRLPRGFERRPLKHPSFPEGAERDSGTPKPPRTGTVPALVPKPPSYPLVKLVGKFYTLKCRFCEVEFHGPLSVQEDWIRHLQQHILKMNYSKPAAPKAGAGPGPRLPAQAPAPASTSTSRTTATPARPPTPPTECAPAVTATEIARVSEEQPTLIPTPIPLPTQAV
ncbi:protein Wiz isoform 1-T1 [Menidia menidia]